MKRQDPFSISTAARHDSRRRNPATLLIIPATVAALLGDATAAGVPAPAAPLSSPENSAALLVLVGLVAIAGAVNLALSIWDKLRPKPPYIERFADRSDCDRRHQALLAEARHISVEAVHDQIDTLATSLRAELKDNDRKAEQRASETHSRINAISAPLNALLGRFEDHVRSHKERA